MTLLDVPVERAQPSSESSGTMLKTNAAGIAAHSWSAVQCKPTHPESRSHHLVLFFLPELQPSEHKHISAYRVGPAKVLRPHEQKADHYRRCSYIPSQFMSPTTVEAGQEHKHCLTPASITHSWMHTQEYATSIKKTQGFATLTNIHMQSELGYTIWAAMLLETNTQA